MSVALSRRARSRAPLAAIALALTLGPRAVLAQEAPALTLDVALARAQERSPRLAALVHELEARESAARYAGQRSNPQLRVEFENFAGSAPHDGFDAAETTLVIEQPLETGGKRTRRSEWAATERDIASADLAAARLDAAAETRLAFFAVLALQERLALAEARAQLARESVASVAALVEAGGASAVETIRARVELGEIELARAQQGRALAAARSALAAKWGAREADFGECSGGLAAETPPAREAVLEALARSPRLALGPAHVAERRAALAHERALRAPDVTLGLGGRRLSDTNSTALLAELSIPLPLFSRNQSGVEQASSRLARAGFEREQAEIDAHAEVIGAYEALAAAHARAQALERELIPQAEEAHSGARRGYRHGYFRFTDVLDAQRTLFELREKRIDSLEAYQAARAELERWLGGALEAKP